jgi:hypothetical protein
MGECSGSMKLQIKRVKVGYGMGRLWGRMMRTCVLLGWDCVQRERLAHVSVSLISAGGGVMRQQSTSHLNSQGEPREPSLVKGSESVGSSGSHEVKEVLFLCKCSGWLKRMCIVVKMFVRVDRKDGAMLRGCMC